MDSSSGYGARMRLREDTRSRGSSGRLDRREEKEKEEKKKKKKGRHSRAAAAEMLPTKVCVIISEGLIHALYLLDLEDKGKGDGDEVSVRKEPNFLIGNAEPFGCYCGLDGSIYMFDGITQLDDVTSGGGKGLNGVYRINMWPGMVDYTNCVVDRSSLVLACRMDSPKVRPASLRFRGGIVVFSTLIRYCNTKPPYPYYTTKPSNPDFFDFEIMRHDARSSAPTMHPLPQLRIRLLASQTWTWSKPDCYFLLLSPYSETEGERVTPRYACGRDELQRPSFHIVSFSVIEDHNLVVQTDFGGLFFIDLDAPVEWKVFQGSLFQLGYENFVISDMVLCASGASKFSTDPGYIDNSTGVVDICFPVSSLFCPNESWRNFAMGLPERSTYPECFPCVLYTNQPEWTLDIFRVDLSKFTVDEEQDKGDVQFVRRIKSLRFLSKYYGISFTPMLVYPF